MAITVHTREMLLKNPNYFQTEQKKFLVISLGTGVVKKEDKYPAVDCAKWGAISWIRKSGAAPIIDCFSQGSGDTVDIHPCTLFQALGSPQNYLRIQEDKLVGDESSVDIASLENLNRLVDIGKALLLKSLSRVNLDTGSYEPVEGGGTNAGKLDEFATMLTDERKERKRRDQLENATP